MANLLSEYATSRDNNFNLLRFIAAVLVLYSHSFALVLGTSDAEPMKTVIGMSWGSIAVDIFFVTSGFLIAGSYIARNNVIAFAWARILRIYPALIMAVLFCVFIVGLYFTTLSTWEYLLNTQTYKFILKNSVLFFGIEYNLPGVFNDIPWKNAVNGSLWTLPYEVKMYVILAFVLFIIAYLGKRISSVTFKNTLFVIATISIFSHIINHFLQFTAINFLKLFYMFFVGATFYVWKDRIILSSKFFLIMFSVLIISTLHKEAYFVVYTIILPYLIFYIAYVPSGQIRKFNKFGDYSYGIYIYAFPVQQSLVALIPDISVGAMIVYAFVITLILSMFSWHFLEKHFLKMKGTYVYIEKMLQWMRITKASVLR